MITQRLLNKFPDWSKIRKDPSSFGARLFSIWGEYFDFAHAENTRVAMDERLLRRGLGHGYTSYISLLEENYMTASVGISGEKTWTYPTVNGIANLVSYPLVMVFSIEELFWSPTTRIDSGEVYGVNNLLVYSDNRTGTVVSNEIDYPAHLTIVIGPSTNWYKKTTFTNVQASGIHAVIIEGLDINHTLIKEYVNVTDDGIYTTKNIFKSIVSVFLEGFDGPIHIYIGSVQDYILDSFHVCATEELEGPLNLRIDTQDVASVDYSKLTYYTNILRQGTEYKNGLENAMDNNEQIEWEQYLLDDNGNSFTAVDIAINPNDTRLYCLDTDGKVHIYDHNKSAFSPPSLESTISQEIYIELIPIKSWACLDETFLLFTRFKKIRYPISSVRIYRKSPTGVLNYLQTNKTWSLSTYTFNGNSIGELVLPEDSWVDFSFENTFDELGQWEFYCETTTPYDTTISYIGVMVDSIEAVKTLDTGVSNSIALWFGPDDRLMVTSSDNGPDGEAYSFYAFNEYSDMFLPDPDNQIFFFRETYDSIEVN